MNSEILRLLKENNELLKYIVKYIEKVDSPQHKDYEDVKDFITNLVANMYINKY